MTLQKILVAWFSYTVNGGIGRFIELARVWKQQGRAVSFASITNDLHTDWPAFPKPILSWEQAASQSWDAVMVPGAGSDQLERLEVLRDPRFGLRVQHILNDPQALDRFERANRAIKPHVVVFNNSHWSLADYRKLEAEAFYVVPGAVDTNRFCPWPHKGVPVNRSFTLGGFASKNLEPLLDALAYLPADVRLRLFGQVPETLTNRVSDLQQQGRVYSLGPTFGQALEAFYRSVDIVVTTETMAGWCNVAAEASAAGVPCVVSRAGTIDFAESMHNAVVLEDVSGPAIADAVGRLIQDRTLLAGIAQRAASTMRARPLSWNEYGQTLIETLERPRINSYYRMPEVNLFGKWDPDVRLAGMEPIFERCAQATVLDLGAAEGVVSLKCAQSGAKLIDGFEFDNGRVVTARSLLSHCPQTTANFFPADLGDWEAFLRGPGAVLLPQYDVVLFLGLYHHLPPATRVQALAGAAARCRNFLAVRTPIALAEAEDLKQRLEAWGFGLIGELPERPEENMGWCGFFARKATNETT